MSDESRVRSHDIIVPRTSRYSVLGAPVSEAEELWLVCHGYGQLASRFIRRFECIDDRRRMIVAPEALSRFYVTGGRGPHSNSDKVGASWMTREARGAEIDDQVAYLDMVVGHVFQGRSRRNVPIVALGFSQGASTVCRWAARTARPPRDVVLWGNGVPSDLFEGEGRAGLARATITVVVGDRDPMASNDREGIHRDQFESAKLVYRFVSYQGGHEIDRKTLLGVVADLRRG